VKLIHAQLSTLEQIIVAFSTSAFVLFFNWSSHISQLTATYNKRIIENGSVTSAKQLAMTFWNSGAVDKLKTPNKLANDPHQILASSTSLVVELINGKIKLPIHKLKNPKQITESG
jgi:hypothetical protein